MPLSKQHIQGEHPMRRNRLSEGVVIRREDVQQFLADSERTNHSDGTIQFYRRKIKRFYKNLPEATVKAGKIVCNKNKYKQLVTILPCLKKKLMDFARQKGILSSLIFRARDGCPIHQSYVPAVIHGACEKERIPCGQACLPVLQRFYFSIRSGIERNFALLVEQAVERMMEQKELSIGWENI